MQQKNISPGNHSVEIDQEVPFHLPEIFFSRTDFRGKIVAGNPVFQRISQYSWGELLKKPHNIIRHSHMPRGVFRLLWDRLREGLATGAYVKNRAKDGRHYWVFAIITPTENGYLSVRIKPCSETFRLVEAEYAKLLELEIAENLSPVRSAELLSQRLGELGFEDYTAFMAHALTREIAARDMALGQTGDPLTACFGALMRCAQSLAAAATRIAGGYRSHQFVPMNLLVQSGRLGHEGQAIGTISGNYRLLADDIREGLATFVQATKRVGATISDGAFLLGTARIQREVVEQFRTEPHQPEIDATGEMALLTRQQRECHASTVSKLLNIRDEVERFQQQTMELRRHASGLSAIRVMGKVESGRLSVSVLNDLIADLETFQQVIATGLADISSVNHDLRRNVAFLMSCDLKTPAGGLAAR